MCVQALSVTRVKCVPPLFVAGRMSAFNDSDMLAVAGFHVKSGGPPAVGGVMVRGGAVGSVVVWWVVRCAVV